MTPKVQATKAKIDRWDNTKPKNLRTSEEIRKYLPTMYLIKDKYTGYIRNLPTRQQENKYPD